MTVPSQINPEGIRNRIEQILSILCEADLVFNQIAISIDGPKPSDSSGDKMPEPPSLGLMLMDTNAMAQRLLSELRALKEQIG